MKRLVFFFLLTFSVLIRSEAQEGVQGRTSAPQSVQRTVNKSTGAEKRADKFYDTAIGIFRGKLKKLTNIEIVIENDSKQVVSMRRSQKTKFFRNSEPISPTAIDLDSPVTVEAIEKGGTSLKALSVTVDISNTKIKDHLSRRYV